MSAPTFAALIAAAAAACVGPATYLDNPGGHRCFVDGVQEGRERIPFRYYGTSRVDVVPRDVAGGLDWTSRPLSLLVEHEPPASPWLFPLDLLVETFHRAIFGPGDVILEADVAPNPSDPRIDPEIRPEGIEDLSRRAQAARIAR